MKLLDTTVAVDHLRGMPGAVALVERLVGDEAEVVAASEVVRFELLAGARDDEREALELFFSALAWLPVDEAVARTAGELAGRYRRAFSGVGEADYLIAATALVHGAELLTTNIRHFPMLPALRPAY